MISINVKTNIDQAIRGIKKELERQIPFAASKAINDTARDVQRALEREVGQSFDRPTPFTRRAIGVTFSTKTKLRASVFIKDKQADYLEVQVKGGVRRPRNKSLLTPVNVALNQYGNIGRYKRKQLLGRKDTFEGVVNGVNGLWQRPKGRGLKLLIAYDKQATYKPRLKFHEVAQKTIAARIDANFRKALDRAIATAR